MLKSIRKAFQVEEIRKRLMFTFLMLIIVRFGSQLPTPGVNPEYIQSFFASQTLRLAEPEEIPSLTFL